MNTTSVRMARETHQRLIRLQASWQRRTGQRLAQSDLVDRALEYAERHADAFIDETGWRPWPREEIQRLRSNLPAFEGPSDLSRDVDKWVYDHDHEMGRDDP